MPLQLALVIPTLNEAANIAPLLDRLHETLRGLDWEVIFVDDNSPDGTASTIRNLARTDARLRVLQRIGRHGLASACVEGMLATAAPYIAVMDADLQHDESILPMMYERIKAEKLDIVIASRDNIGGGPGGLTRRRALLSRVGSRLSRAVCKTDLSDPMSGFFMVDRNFLEEVAHLLSGVGFKILVDILASARRPVRFVEVPYRFRQRLRGESKLDINVGLEYLELLLDKFIGQIVPLRFVMFVLVGGLGILVHAAVLAVFYYAGVRFIFSQAWATLAAMTFNFLLNNVTTFRERRLRGLGIVRGLLVFYAACSVGALINFSFASFLLAAGLQWYLAGIVGTIVSSLWNYGMNTIFTWRRDKRVMERRRAASQAAVDSPQEF